jgi:hypothetical protein
LTGYEAVAADSAVFASVGFKAVVAGSVECPADKRPLSGGWEPLVAATTTTPTTPGNGPVTQLWLASSAPTVNGWSVSFRNNATQARGPVQFRVWALCVSQP